MKKMDLAKDNGKYFNILKLLLITYVYITQYITYLFFFLSMYSFVSGDLIFTGLSLSETNW